jgi:hypothetical protein
MSKSMIFPAPIAKAACLTGAGISGLDRDDAVVNWI